MKKLLIMVLLMAPLSSFAREKIVINEEKLRELINNNVPSIEKIDMLIVQSNLDRTAYNQKYSPTVGAEASYQGMDGKMFSDYQGNFDDPARRAGVTPKPKSAGGCEFQCGSI